MRKNLSIFFIPDFNIFIRKYFSIFFASLFNFVKLTVIRIAIILLYTLFLLIIHFILSMQYSDCK
jgi:hypothetical protein